MYQGLTSTGCTVKPKVKDFFRSSTFFFKRCLMVDSSSSCSGGDGRFSRSEEAPSPGVLFLVENRKAKFPLVSTRQGDEDMTGAGDAPSRASQPARKEDGSGRFLVIVVTQFKMWFFIIMGTAGAWRVAIGKTKKQKNYLPGGCSFECFPGNSSSL